MKIALLFKILIGIIMISSFNGCSSNNILEQLLEDSNQKILTVVENKDKYELQIIYTRVLREDKRVNLKSYSFNEKPDRYFYPSCCNIDH